MVENEEPRFISFDQAENTAYKQLQEMCDKMILDDLSKQNKCGLGILKESPTPIIKVPDDMFKYYASGVQVFDPTKVYIIRPIFEEYLPWYKRLWNWMLKQLLQYLYRI